LFWLAACLCTSIGSSSSSSSSAAIHQSLDFAVSLPQPEGDSEFVRRLQAADSRLQRLSKLVQRIVA
jgi:hypothetical protein